MLSVRTEDVERYFITGGFLDGGHFSKTSGIEKLRRESSIERVDTRLQRVVEPVLGVDDVQIISGFENPSEARLPAQHGALRVVLNVIHPRNPRAELELRDDSVQACMEAALSQLHLVPLTRRVDDHARA